MVRGALVPQEPAAIGGLEREIHLQATPVRAARVAPASLVAVNAEPGLEVRRMVGPPPGGVLPVPPFPRQLPEPRDRVRGQRTRSASGRPTVDHGQPAPRAGPEAPDMAAPVRDSPRVRIARGRLGGSCSGCRARGRGGASGRRAAGGRSRSGHACQREQEPAGEDRAPQCLPPRGRLQVGGRTGGIYALGRAPLGAAYAIVVPRVATAATLVRCQGNACDTRALTRR
jgi:hypothetical protein